MANTKALITPSLISQECLRLPTPRGSWLLRCETSALSLSLDDFDPILLASKKVSHEPTGDPSHLPHGFNSSFSRTTGDEEPRWCRVIEAYDAVQDRTLIRIDMGP